MLHQVAFILFCNLDFTFTFYYFTLKSTCSDAYVRIMPSTAREPSEDCK